MTIPSVLAVGTAVTEPPVFVISFRYRRDLVASLETMGFDLEAGHTGSPLERQYVHSGARVVVVDMRGAIEKGLAGLRALSPHVQARRGGLIALLGARDERHLGAVAEAGATHFLISPFRPIELGTTVRCAISVAAQACQSLPALTTPSDDHGNVPGWEWDSATSLVTVSPGLVRTFPLGLPSFVVGIEALLRFVEPRQQRRVFQTMRAVVESGQPADVEMTVRVPDLPPRRLLNRVRPTFNLAGKVTGLSATIEDISTTAPGQLVQSHFDILTGLPNQSHARTLVQQALKDVEEFAPSCALLLIAISRFDQINAAYGRSIADGLLQAIARRLRRQLLGDGIGDRCTPCRLGGAEFAVLITGATALQDSLLVAQRVADIFERPFLLGGRAIHLVCRMGIAVADIEVTDAEVLFQRADTALTRAKPMEPNSFQVFAPGDSGPSVLRASLETDLRRALTDDRLDFVFHPQVDIATGRIVGAETLVRWRHPELGQIAPEMLLSVAENAEIMVRFDEKVLERSLEEMRRWTGGPLGNLRVSVNMSAAQLRSTQFAEQVVSALRRADVAPQRLTLEVTETSLVENLETAARTLALLRSVGIGVAIDDFGTGYSSLAYLKSLPVDYLKVDKQFITDLAHQRRDRILIHGLVEMARSLGIGVVAEGVETEAQLEELVREGCNWYQGFLCTPPLPAAELATFVPNWNNRRAKVAATHH